MALDKYREKRDFKNTPEPRGSLAPVGGPARTKTPRFFCVQKHLASHLHYDFRLEHNGVLLSWAVPKGPSLDPAVKRLAMHVEDHPVEYGTFEGVIPEGYGAGIVQLWDLGTWIPETDDVDAALKKGDLKFGLDGYKLKGSWVLVRTRGPRDPSGRSWLLIKHRDDWSGDLDITRFAPLSVKSEGDLEHILAADTPAIWTSNRPVKGGATGAMLNEIIAKAAALKAGAQREPVKGKGQGVRGKGAKSKGQRAESREQRAESKEQRAKGRGQRAESKEQRAESKEQRAKSRGQRATSKGQARDKKRP